MLRRVLILGVVLGVVACSRTFDPSAPPEIRPGVVINPTLAEVSARQDGRVFVAEVTDLSIKRTRQGVLIRATGLPPRQGFWAAELVDLGLQNGSRVFAFRARPPEGPTPVGTERSREVVVGRGLSLRQLGSAGSVTIIGAESQITVGL